MTESTEISVASDPVVIARTAFDRADEALEHALKRGDSADADRCNDVLIQADEAFANAVPTTEAGVRLKFAALVHGLVIARSGESLTPRGADNLLIHLASLQVAWAQVSPLRSEQGRLHAPGDGLHRPESSRLWAAESGR